MTYNKLDEPMKKVQQMNLNDMEIVTDVGFAPVQNNSTRAGNVEVYFRDLESALVEKIQTHDVSLGCVAWLTSAPILKALSQVDAQIVVQKEDFLRPDIGADPKSWGVWLRRMYGQISLDYDRYIFPYLGKFSYCGDPEIEGVRCVGNHNRDKHPAFPRMHNKFMVFADKVEAAVDDYGGTHYTLEPKAVWTGSFNFTKNAGRSLENAVVITEPAIVQAYYQEYQQIAAMSEPLNWKTYWSAPEWRLGS